jgi:hypothetical protein
MYLNKHKVPGYSLKKDLKLERVLAHFRAPARLLSTPQTENLAGVSAARMVSETEAWGNWNRGSWRLQTENPVGLARSVEKDYFLRLRANSGRNVIIGEHRRVEAVSWRFAVQGDNVPPPRMQGVGSEQLELRVVFVRGRVARSVGSGKDMRDVLMSCVALPADSKYQILAIVDVQCLLPERAHQLPKKPKVKAKTASPVVPSSAPPPALDSSAFAPSESTADTPVPDPGPVPIPVLTASTESLPVTRRDRL